MKGISLALCIILLLGCKQSERTIGLFVNPSRTFDLQKIHIFAKSGTNVILDTVIQNNHIDKSVLLKRFNVNLVTDNTLSIGIGSISKSIKIPSNTRNCVDVFTFYDDHTMINNVALGVENQQIEKGIMANYKQIIDSLKKSKNGIYDKIEIDVKNRSCK
ncbi:hypothetical protein GM921_09820 [Pedobacter sp. LMG 31464]|uniref:Uncharacterized protein n=1 Tax=Pedobacter planticolens TaxID=2679964 RepID=A0A923IW35_9SPHI|nr:hypothetical protein [Pedobacter planticolens]MBB2145784.1 hypothetical protein [Pedobacter planticolens]